MQKITIFALHLDYGGIEKYISYFCKMFEKKYNIEIICTYKMNSTPAFEFSKNINIKYLIESTAGSNALISTNPFLSGAT